MKEFQIWSSGYAAQGEHGTADFLATEIATTFDEAIAQYLEKRPELKEIYKIDERWVTCPVSEEHPLGRKLANIHSIGFCRLYDNQKDARKQFG